MDSLPACYTLLQETAKRDKRHPEHTAWKEAAEHAAIRSSRWPAQAKSMMRIAERLGASGPEPLVQAV